jgi:DeoR family transcriptional regulator of aga operon
VAGATEISLPAAAVKRRMLLGAARRVVLVPAAGVGCVRTGAVCAVDDVDVLVTGAGASAGALDALREAGVEVVPA